MRTRDGGTHWIGIPAPKAPLAGGPTPEPGQRVAVRELRFADTVNGWAAGGALYATHDGGAHGQKAGPQHTVPVRAERHRRHGRGVLVLALVSGDSELRRTTDDGQTLTNVHAPTPIGAQSWNDLGFTTPSRAVVVLDSTALETGNDAGAHWTTVRFAI